MPEVALRPVEDGDLPLFFEWQADAESSALAAVAARDGGAFASHWARIRADPGTTLRTVLADGAVAGNALAWTGDDGRMVGYWIGRPYWGRGIASEALRLFLEVERERPLFATVAGHNAASRRVLEKAGFRLVGASPVDDGTAAGPFALLRFHLR